MNKGRVVFLFGAGSTLAWGSPLTSELTKLIRESGFKITDNNTTITEFIFQKLLSSGYSENDINFETIINVIEELIVYYSKFDSKHGASSLLSSLFQNKYEDQIFNFSIKDGKEIYGYQLEIPKGIEYKFSRYALNKEKPKQFFLLHLLGEILTGISGVISKYAYQTESLTFINAESPISKSFMHWMKVLSHTNTLRMYTLNYDRLFKILLEKIGISIFEGFDCGENVPLGGELPANITRILSDLSCNTYYNLHGSVFWRVSNEFQNFSEMILTPTPTIPSNDDYTVGTIEKGKPLYITNIITGYQKAQKSVLSPFRQMQSTFDRDCCCAEKIYIIGYSFGDQHINQIIKSAIQHNKNLQLIIIDPSFVKNDVESEFIRKFFPDRQELNISLKNVDKNLRSYFNGVFVVHTTTFEEFLKKVVC